MLSGGYTGIIKAGALERALTLEMVGVPARGAAFICTWSWVGCVWTCSLSLLGNLPEHLGGLALLSQEGQ